MQAHVRARLNLFIFELDLHLLNQSRMFPSPEHPGNDGASSCRTNWFWTWSIRAMAASKFEEVDLTVTRPPTSSGVFSKFDVLRQRTYFIIWIGTILAFSAYYMSTTAQGVVAYQLSGSNSAVGLVQLGQGAAMVVLNPIAGALSDRLPKRLLIITAQWIVALVMLTMALLVLSDSITLLFLALGAFVVGCSFSFNAPVRTAFLKEVVDATRLGRAMALIPAGTNFSRVIGPLIAGGILAWEAGGVAATYLVITCIMVIVTVTMYQIPATSSNQGPTKRSVLDEMRSGFAYVRSTPRVLHILVSYHLTCVVGFSYYVLMPGFASSTLHVGTGGLGLLLGVAAIGALVFSLIVTAMADSKYVRQLVTASGLLFGVTLIGLGSAPGFGIALGIILLVGGASSSFQTLNNILASRHTDQDYLGRVFSLIYVTFGFIAIAGLPVGYGADLMGERSVLIVMGGAVCMITFLLFLWERQIGRSEARTVAQL
jgi:MFS family permease